MEKDTYLSDLEEIHEYMVTNRLAGFEYRKEQEKKEYSDSCPICKIKDGTIKRLEIIFLIMWGLVMLLLIFEVN